MDVGTISGKVLVFGGVYSNLQSLEALRAIANRENINPENVICTGDIVGYCAQPEECLQMVKAWDIKSIAGNVEIQIRNDDEDCGCNFDDGTRCDILSRNWYPFALKHVSNEMKHWLQSLPNQLSFQYAGYSILVLHGGYRDVAQFIFRSTNWSLKSEIMDESRADIVLAGHCGLPFHHIRGGRYWLNAGVIGMPANDGTSRVWYMILDDEEGFDFAHRSFGYDHQRTATLMGENRLPGSYAKTLSDGIWDNCEVLPKEETSQQGIPLDL